jgi:HlyD family secretion protein
MGEVLAGRRRWIWVAAAVVVLALIVYGVVHALTADATEKPKAAATAAADLGDVTTEVATTGTLQPAQTRSLSFAVKGTVESVSVRAGTTVTAGQVLAKVDDTDAATAVDDAQDSLDDAEDALATARSNASRSTSSTSGTTAGCDVAAAYLTGGGGGTPTTSPTPTPTATTASPAPTATTTAPAATRTATARPTATATSTKGRTGTGSGAGSCTGTTGGGSGSGSGGQQGGQSSGSDQILSAQQRVTQANTTLEEAEEALEGATITAPIAGRIISVSGKVGSQVSAGSTFITLADVYDMQISASFPEADADRLAIAQKGVVTLADRAGKEFKSTVVQVDPIGTSDGTMVKFGVILSFDEAPQDLLVGQSASVKITTGSKTGVLRVPTTAVHNVRGDKGTVLRNGSQVEVGIGLRGDQYTEVTSGLTEGDQVTRSW